MSWEDEKRAEELAELARHFFLWLRENELPQLPGLKGRGPHQFHLHAGVYRATTGRAPLPDPVQWWHYPDEARWLRGYGHGVSHVLMASDPDIEQWSPRHGSVPGPDGRSDPFMLHENEIYLEPGEDLSRPGAMRVAFPILDSRRADVATLMSVRYHTFAGLIDRVDLVWDDLEEARRAGFLKMHSWVFKYPPPRPLFARNINAIDPLDEDMRDVRDFRKYLYWYGTYENGSGNYYQKWRADEPVDRDDREYRPTKLSKQYLQECFHEWVLQRDESYLLLELPGADMLYRLSYRTPTGRRTRELEVKEVLRRHRLGDVTNAPPEIPPQIHAVLFHALDGARSLPAQLGPRSRIRIRGSTTGRHAYDYKALLSWYLESDELLTGLDEEACFDLFVDIFFPDVIYPVQGAYKYVEKSTYSSSELAGLAGAALEPVRRLLDEMERTAGTAPAMRYAIQGWEYGRTDATKRRLIGISPTEFVYEWHVEKSIVTRMPLGKWLAENAEEEFLREIYERTKHIIPYAQVVVWGGVAAAGGAVIGGAALSVVARQTIRGLIANETAKRVTKEAIRTAAPHLVAVILDRLASLLPPTRSVPVEFTRGFLHGFGAGAVTHYLENLDKRAERQLKKLYKDVLNKASKGVYRAHQTLVKIIAAYHKLSALFHAIREVWKDEYATILVDVLKHFSRRLALSLLLLLILAVYIDRAYLGGHDDQRKQELWARKQRDLFQHLITETGEEVAVWAEQLREDARTRRSPTPAIVRERDEKVARKLAGAAATATSKTTIVSDVLKEILTELGVTGWDELASKSFVQLLALGLDATLDAFPDLETKVARAFGEATGELVGTLFLERAVLSAAWRTRLGNSTKFSPRVRGTLAEGTGRALLAYVREVLEGVSKAVKTSAQHHRAPASPHLIGPRPARSHGSWLKELLEMESSLSKSIGALADESGLPERIRAVATHAQSDSPPGIEDVLARRDGGTWPTDAIRFFLECWTLVATREALAAIALTQDASPFGNQLRLEQLLAIVGLDVDLDDSELEQLRARLR